MKAKRLFSLLLAGGLVASLASCKEKDVRNTIVPYGSLDTSATIATSNKDFSLSFNDYYNSLRYSGYELVTSQIKKIFYADEAKAISNLIKSTSFADLSNEDKLTLSYTDEAIDEARYNDLKIDYCDEFSNYFINAIFATTSVEALKTMEQEKIDSSITKYIETLNRQGLSLTKDQIKYSFIEKHAEFDDKIALDLTLIPQNVLDLILYEKAENLYSQKELYKIADLEYLNEGTEDEKKNSNYVFKDSSIEYSYNNSYKTFGKYQAVIITYNSRKEAYDAIDALGYEITDENKAQAYLDLYNNYFAYEPKTSLEDEEFTYTVSLRKDDLSKISSSVSTLITETLENDGDYLFEPRNLDNKYVMAYRIKTEYDLTGTSEQKEFDDLEDNDPIITQIKNGIIKANYNGYKNTAYQELLEDSTLEIYDPYFEYKFNYANSDYYDLISADNANINKNLIFKLNDTEFTVEEFYDLATAKYAASIISKHFQLEYANLYADEFVEEDTKEENKDTLDAAIKVFENNENTTYPAAIGLETYLLATYGYDNKDSVLKYSFTASSALSAYKSKVLFDEWATDDHNISEDAVRILDQILSVGNDKYSEIFNIDLDHLLINVDFDFDGSPDDPEVFLTKHEDLRAEFEADVEKLAQALYTEAIHEDYADNSLFERLKYIITQYNKGAKLRSMDKTWDQIKKESKFHFLLTTEQLASNGDITQDSVSNFVEPFADYVKELYKKAVDTKDLSINEHGNFFTVNNGLLTKAEDASSIEINADNSSLCKTVFGYHLLILNEYDEPSSLEVNEDNDTNGYQNNIEVLISTGEDADDDSDNIYVKVSSYNDSKTTANIEQLFIYYVQSKTGATSSLDSSVSSNLSYMFTKAIDAYSSSNFQTVLLLDLLNITSTNETINNVLEAERNYYANQVTGYDSESEFASWVSKDSTIDWSRPNQK